MFQAIGKRLRRTPKQEAIEEPKAIEPQSLSLQERSPEYQFGRGNYDVGLQVFAWEKAQPYALVLFAPLQPMCKYLSVVSIALTR